jgi:hypothetical protein
MLRTSLALLAYLERFWGVRFGAVRVGLGKLLACLNLPYRPLRFINFA